MTILHRRLKGKTKVQICLIFYSCTHGTTDLTTYEWDNYLATK